MLSENTSKINIFVKIIKSNVDFIEYFEIKANILHIKDLIKYNINNIAFDK